MFNQVRSMASGAGRKLLLAPLFGGLLVGCGFTSTGDGSNTLLVNATVRYDAADNRSRVDVRVRQDGDFVEDAEVVLVDHETGTRFPLTASGVGEGRRYRDTIEGYRRWLLLRVDSGSDFVEARLEGPGRHTIDKPGHNERLRRSNLSSFDIQWGTTDGIKADRVDIEVHDDGCKTTLVDDKGKIRLPCSGINAGAANVALLRSNRVELAGGSAGSEFSLGYEVSNNFVVED